MLAFESAIADKRAADALSISRNTEKRNAAANLKAYEQKLILQKAYETPGSILKTDLALANIKKAYEGVDYDMLGAGETAFTALEKMGFPEAQLRRFSNIVFPGEPYGGGVVGNTTLEDI